jgi:hypothetical protein
MNRASRVASTDAYAMAVEQERNSSSTGRRIVSDDDNVDSPRLHKLETCNAREWDDDDESDAISQQSSGGPPNLVSSSDEDDEEHLAREEFIRESAENPRRTRNPGNVLSSLLKANLSSD